MDPVRENFQLCESSSCTDLPDLTADVSYRGYHNFIADNEHKNEEQEESENEKVGNDNVDISEKKVLKEEMVNEGIKIMSYAVRGPLMIRANELQKQLEEGLERPFKNVIKANIGDAHAMGNKPITFIRQVMAMVTFPPLIESDLFPEDARIRARTILGGCRGGSVGSYSDSPGIEIIRRHVAEYIMERDGGVRSDWRNIMLCAGASEGIRAILKLMTHPVGSSGKRPGVLIPIPQYPLYSASLAEYNMEQVGYYLDEAKNWALDPHELERAIKESKSRCSPRAIVVINPGNPTGQVITKENIETIIRFAHKEKLYILADEVYQHNVYAEGSQFHSFKKVLCEMGEPYSSMEMSSFMSCSKGYMGECGLRGGYTETINMDPTVMAMLQKSISAKLCPTILGQACMDIVVNPPRPGEPSYDSWLGQKDGTLHSLARRAKLVADTLNTIEGFTCNTVQGAMYAFPRVHLPSKVLEAAAAAGQQPDVFYALNLLEATGICVIPGSGFGQAPGTFHFRTTILPQEPMIVEMLARLKEFHVKFLKDFS